MVSNVIVYYVWYDRFEMHRRGCGGGIPARFATFVDVTYNKRYFSDLTGNITPDVTGCETGGVHLVH